MHAAPVPTSRQGRAGSRRGLFGLLAICAATFVGVILAFKGPSAPPAGDIEVGTALEPAVAIPSAPVASAPGTARAAPASRTYPVLPVAAPVSYEISPVEEQVSPTAVEAHQWPAESVGAADADARATTIRKLDADDPVAFGSLEQTVRADGSARNRLLAVNALRLMGRNPENRARVAVVLQSATTDADANVAANARDALQELSQ